MALRLINSLAAAPHPYTPELAAWRADLAGRLAFAHRRFLRGFFRVLAESVRDLSAFYQRVESWCQGAESRGRDLAVLRHGRRELFGLCAVHRECPEEAIRDFLVVNGEMGVAEAIRSARAELAAVWRRRFLGRLAAPPSAPEPTRNESPPEPSASNRPTSSAERAISSESQPHATPLGTGTPGVNPPKTGRQPRPKRRKRNEGKSDRCVGVYVAYLERNQLPPSPTEIAAQVGCAVGTASRAIKRWEDKRKGIAQEDGRERHKNRA
jgi:hypothetical protein